MPTISQNDVKLLVKTGEKPWEVMEFPILDIPADPEAIPFPNCPVSFRFSTYEPLREVHTFVGYDGRILGRWLMESYNCGITWESVERLPDGDD